MGRPQATHEIVVTVRVVGSNQDADRVIDALCNTTNRTPNAYWHGEALYNLDKEGKRAKRIELTVDGSTVTVDEE